MEQMHEFYTDKVKLGKKGQITIPKKIRDEDKLQEDDLFIVTHLPGGDIILKKKKVKTPEDKLWAILRTMPKFDWRKAWEEVREERRREHR
ncbi:AbrB/MazE/SpoVT family DNA-binding domain-containing protein [Candidatus Woesearchaeota archaeon]|nr:AbrB/MazE/SpoVT family DNA-binding domain-containing protein [Candidatus Woesearchaeota archaeon]